MSWSTIRGRGPSVSGVFPVAVDPRGSQYLAHWNAESRFWGTPAMNLDAALLMRDYPFTWPKSVPAFWKDSCIMSTQVQSARKPSSNFSSVFGSTPTRGSVFRPVSKQEPATKPAPKAKELPVKEVRTRRRSEPLIEVTTSFDAYSNPPERSGLYQARLQRLVAQVTTDWIPLLFKNGFWRFPDGTRIPSHSRVLDWRGVTKETHDSVTTTAQRRAVDQFLVPAKTRRA